MTRQPISKRARRFARFPESQRRHSAKLLPNESRLGKRQVRERFQKLQSRKQCRLHFVHFRPLIVPIREWCEAKPFLRTSVFRSPNQIRMDTTLLDLFQPPPPPPPPPTEHTTGTLWRFAQSICRTEPNWWYCSWQ